MNLRSIPGGGSSPSLNGLNRPPKIRRKRRSPLNRDFALALVASLAATSHVALAQASDCTNAVVVSSPKASIPEQTAITALLEEASKRTGVRWSSVTELPRSQQHGCLIVAATARDLPSLRPELLKTPYNTPEAPESFTIQSANADGHETIVIAGHDARGLLYGIGDLLRTMEFTPNKAFLPEQLNVAETPQKPIRGHQLGYRAKNNTYDAWTVAQFEQYIRELALFGANTIQLIAPESDDAPSSPLFPAPALDTLIGTSRILDRYGLDCSIFYPEMENDYAKPEDTARELARFETLFRQIPRVDSIWIPGGDPGHTPPALLFPLVEKEAAILRKYHPEAKVYLSAQGMDTAHFEDFYHLLDQHPAWLTGVFFGPQSRQSFEAQRHRIPARYPILFYPDIAHTMHAQFPVPQWDPVYALTEGREPIDPRPADESEIYKHFAHLQDGFITYSEGVNDDVNKFLWTQWGWNSSASAETVLHQYSRFFLGPQWTQRFSKGLVDLERNWRGPMLSNPSIQATAAEFEAMERDPSAPKDKWRFELALERAYYDAFLKARFTAETTQQQQAIEKLSRAPQTGSEAAIAQAKAAVTQQASPQLAVTQPASMQKDRAQIFALANDLYHRIGLQLSTQLYGASNWERGANLDRIDIPLNDRVWLLNQFASIRKLPSEAEKQQAIAQIVHWGKPQPGTRHDDLGNPAEEPDLARILVGGPSDDPDRELTSDGQSGRDPELYQQPIDGVSDHTPLDGARWSQLTYAETLYETPLRLNYDHLDPTRHYRLRVTYGGEDYTATIGIVANNAIPIEPVHDRATNPETLEFEIPQSATGNGKLTIAFTRPAGTGGSGRGHQVAETWLIPEP